MPLRYPLPILLLALLAPTALAQDLSITASAEDDSGEAGDRVTLDYTVTLTGAKEIEDVPVGFYFSEDQTLSDDDVFSEREDVDAESDEPESDNEQIDIPESLDPGEYFLLVVVDDLDVVAETDETNNTVAIPFTVTGGGSGGGGDADLVVTSASAEPNSAAPGDQVQVDYALANQGSEQAGESQVAFYFSRDRAVSSSDVLAEREEVDEVDAGDSEDGEVTLTVPNSLSAGDYFLLVVADGRNAVAETSENNNTFAIPFTVTSGGGGGGGDADLVVTSASAEPNSAEPGDQVQVDYTLVNEGTEQAGGSLVGFYLSTDRFLSSGDELLATENVDEVDANSSEDGEETLTIPASTAPGDYFILVVADDGNDVTESSESNNVFDIPFTVTPTTASEGGTATAALRLDAPAPNPVAGRAVVAYTLREAGPVRLAVYDVLGRQVAVLADGVQPAGTHEATWNAAGLAAGTYVVRLVAGGEAQAQQATVVR